MHVHKWETHVNVANTGNWVTQMHAQKWETHVNVHIGVTHCAYRTTSLCSLCVRGMHGNYEKKQGMREKEVRTRERKIEGIDKGGRE